MKLCNCIFYVPNFITCSTVRKRWLFLCISVAFSPVLQRELVGRKRSCYLRQLVKLGTVNLKSRIDWTLKKKHNGTRHLN